MEGAASTPVASAPVTPVVETAKVEVTPKETKPVKEIFKVNIDGKEEEVDKDTLLRDYQKFKAGDKKLAETAKLRKEAEQRWREIAEKETRLSELQKLDSEEAFTHLIDKYKDDPQKKAKIRAQLEKFLLAELEMEQASPDVKARIEAEKRAAALEKKIKEQEELSKKSKMEEATQSQRNLLEKTILQAAEMSGLPATEWNIKSMAEVMYRARKAGHQMSPEQVAEFVRQDRVENIQALGGGIATKIAELAKSGDSQSVMQYGEHLTNLFGKPILDALRLYDLAKIKSQRAGVPAPTVDAPKMQTEESSGKRLSWDEDEMERKRLVAELDRQWRSGKKIG